MVDLNNPPPAVNLHVETLQSRVHPWMMACFGPEISADKLERGDRLLEELFELLQSGDYPRERIRALENYTWSRPKGEPHQEVGGVMITLAAYCLANGIDMHQAGETELARIWTKVDAIRAKQAAKPTGSALPVVIEMEWVESPFDPYQHFAETDVGPYLIEFARGQWQLKWADKNIGSLISLRGAKEAAEKHFAGRAALAASEGSADA